MKILQWKAHPLGLLLVQLYYAIVPPITTTLNSPLEFPEKGTLVHRPSKNGPGTKGLNKALDLETDPFCRSFMSLGLFF